MLYASSVGLLPMARPTVLTPAALAQVKTLVKEGVSAAEIAGKMGCTLGTLRVRCSQFGISLRRVAVHGRKSAWTTSEVVPSTHGNGSRNHRTGNGSSNATASRQGNNSSTLECHVELKVLISEMTAERLHQHAALNGNSGAILAARLLTAIAHDNLYDAVLDGS
jgi:hypothetical protein